MPLYEYECEACGKRFEVIQKFSDAPVEICAKCGSGPIRKLMSSPAIQFKGSGWYITDYGQKGKSGGSSDSSSGSSAKSDEGKKTDGAAAASDSSSKSDSKSDTSAASSTGSS